MGSRGESRREEGAESAEFWADTHFRSGEELELTAVGVGREYGRRSGWLRASQPSVSMEPDSWTVGVCRYGAVETV